MEPQLKRVTTPMASRPGGENGLVVGATRLGWLYGKSRKWGSRLLRSWAEEQARGGPIRVFIGVGGALYTTLPVVHQYMPPGRDIALYRRVEALEVDVADAHRRIDQGAIRLTEIERRLARFGARSA
jgi:hypothetical protein